MFVYCCCAVVSWYRYFVSLFSFFTLHPLHRKAGAVVCQLGKLRRLSFRSSSRLPKRTRPNKIHGYPARNIKLFAFFAWLVRTWSVICIGEFLNKCMRMKLFDALAYLRLFLLCAAIFLAQKMKRHSVLCSFSRMLCAIRISMWQHIDCEIRQGFGRAAKCGFRHGVYTLLWSFRQTFVFSLCSSMSMWMSKPSTTRLTLTHVVYKPNLCACHSHWKPVVSILWVTRRQRCTRAGANTL